MDKIKRNNAIYIAFLSISIAIMAVIIIIPMVQSMRYVRHTVDYNSIVAMGSYHIKISNATYLKDKKELYFALSAKEESNYSGSISSKPEISNYTLRYYDDNGKYHTEDMLKKYTVSQKNDFTEIITVSDIPSGYDYVYIELKCTIAAYDEPDTVDEFGDVIKGQHHDEIVKEQYFMFDKKDVRVIDSKDDNQDDMSIVIEEQTDSTSEKITTDPTNRHLIAVSAPLTGVYSVNRGYCIFRQIDILSETSDHNYYIINTGTYYGLSAYDRIILNAGLVTENQIIY